LQALLHDEFPLCDAGPTVFDAVLGHVDADKLFGEVARFLALEGDAVRTGNWLRG
jgi:hypothetical protein